MDLFTLNGRFLTQNATGVQRYAREVTLQMDAAMVARGLKASLVTPAAPVSPLSLRAISTRIVTPRTGHIWEQTKLRSPGDRPLLNLCNTAPAFGTPNIVCIHDVSVFTAPDTYSWSFRTFYKLLLPWIARRAISVATVSKEAASHVASHLGLALKKIAVLPNGHEHALRWNADRSKYAGTHGRPYVLVIGNLARHKNISRLIGIADALDELGLDLKIAGGSASIYAAAGHVGAPNLHFLGRVSDDDLAYLLQNALCLAFPSISEGFGIPALEAFALGCPVIASETSSLPEVCGDAALYASPFEDARWIANIRDLVGSASLREDLRERGFAQAKKFSWAASARGYLDLIEAA